MMSSNSVWNQRLEMLMACASPGSALAYLQAKAESRPGMMRRIRADQEPRTDGPTAEEATSHEARRSWLGRLWDRLEQWSWEREVSAHEAYLSQATDLADLEARIRRVDGDDGLSRGRVLS